MLLNKNIAFILIVLCSLSCQNNTNTNAATKSDSTATGSPAPLESEPVSDSSKKTILFFGNSLTAGLGVNPEDAFVGLIEKRIDSLDLSYKVVNSGVSGETTAGGLGRIDWILEQYQPSIFVLELGGNDALRGIDPATSYKNLQGIISTVKKKYPQTTIVLAGMEAPPNMGETFSNAFRKIYRDLAKENNLKLIPFLLDGVGGIPELNQKDGIHPTEAGHKIIAEVIWKVLENTL